MIMQISTLFADKSDLYAASRSQYPRELFSFITDLVVQHNAAWDCATGNGQAAVGVAETFDLVQATDIRQQQITHSLTRNNIHYSVCCAEKTAFVDNQFDLVTVAQALHWFDFDKFWPEVNRVLKPDGVFCTFAYIWCEVSPVIDIAVEGYIKRIDAPYWASNNKLVWDSYKGVEFPFAQIGTPKFTLQNLWGFQLFMNYIHTWSATRRCIEVKGIEFFERAKLQIVREWGDPKEKRLVTSPLTVMAGRNG